MTYRQSAAELASELADLVITRGCEQLTTEDALDVAVLGRRAALGTIRSTLATVTGLNPDPTLDPWRNSPKSVNQLISQPVFNLQRELAAYPAPGYRTPLSERMKSPPTKPAEIAWYDVAKHAELAAHDFTDFHSRLDPEHRWTVVADAAAIARTLYVLDGQLLQAAEHLDPRLAEALREARDSALPYVAEETLVVARSGPLPDLDTVTKEPQTTTPVQVTSPAAAVEAQNRLRRQLLRAYDLSPEVIGITALTQARLMDGAAHLLADHDPTRAHLAATIRDHLRVVRADDPQLAALVPGDQLPRLQSREMARYVHAAAQVSPATVEGAQVRRSMAAIVDRAPRVVAALETATDRQLFTHRWAVAYAGEQHDAAAWGIWTEKLDRPRLLTQLEEARAVTDAHRLRAAHSPVGHTPQPHPHEALADVVRNRVRPVKPERRHLGVDR